MPSDQKITDGPNERAVGESLAGTGPGLPDEALGPGEELPTPPTDKQTAEIAEKLGVPAPHAEG
jgi:hypothetical protein